MQKKVIAKIVTTLLIIFAIVMLSTNAFARITPGQITGDTEINVELDFIDKLTDAVRIIGTFVAVGAMMVIGIKYVTGSIEEKANYKKSMMPYLIGCFVLFGASVLAPQIKDAFDNMGTDTESIGNEIIGIIQAIGSVVSVGVLMILGIKYMLGTTEERASYKRTMLPYIIGVILIFAAVNLTAVIYSAIPHDETSQSTVTNAVED